MLPFVGPSYTLPSAQAAAQRTVNMYLLRVETPEKGPFVLQAMPGFSLFGSAEWPPVVPPIVGGSFLLEDGGYLLLEDGSRLLLG